MQTIGLANHRFRNARKTGEIFDVPTEFVANKNGTKIVAK